MTTHFAQIINDNILFSGMADFAWEICLWIHLH